MVFANTPPRKLHEISVIALCVFCIMVGLYAYFVLKRGRGQLPLWIGALCFFTAGVVVEAVLLASRHPSRRDLWKNPTRKEAYLMSAGGLLLGLSGLSVAVFKEDMSRGERVIAFFGFFLFAGGAAATIRRVRRRRQEQSERQEEPRDPSSGKA